MILNVFLTEPNASLTLQYRELNENRRGKKWNLPKMVLAKLQNLLSA